MNMVVVCLLGFFKDCFSRNFPGIEKGEKGMTSYTGLAYFVVAYIISIIFHKHESYIDWLIPEKWLAIAFVAGWFIVNFFLTAHVALENSLIELQNTSKKEREIFAEILEKRAEKDECVKKLRYWLNEISGNTQKEGGYNLADVMNECAEALRKASISEAVIHDLVTPPKHTNDWYHFDSKLREIIVNNLKY